MAQSPLTATIPTEALVDANGNVTTSWLAFFVRLMTRTGGTVGVDTAGLQTQINTETAQRQAADTSLSTQITGVSNAGAATAANLSAQIAAETTARQNADFNLLPKAGGTTGTVGFQGAAAISQPTVTGSRSANAALASLLTALADYGLVVDSSTP